MIQRWSTSDPRTTKYNDHISKFNFISLIIYLYNVDNTLIFRLRNETLDQKTFPKVYFLIQRWSTRDPRTTKYIHHISKFKVIGSITYWFQICSIWIRITLQQRIGYIMTIWDRYYWWVYYVLLKVIEGEYNVIGYLLCHIRRVMIIMIQQLKSLR